MPDKDNFIVTGNSTSANNLSTGVGRSSSKGSSSGPIYGRVVSINTKDRSITYELIKNTVSSVSAVNNKQKLVGIAYNMNPTMTRLPKVNEIVPLIKGPSSSVGNSANQYDEITYYQSPVSIQNTVDDNSVPLSTPVSSEDLNNNYKLNNIGVSKPNNNNEKPKERVGTDVDGIVGEFTSRFIFPGGFIEYYSYTLVNGIKTDEKTRIEGSVNPSSNAGLVEKIKQFDLTIQNLTDWNTYQKWLKDNNYAGIKDMNKIPYQYEVYQKYKKVNPNFWVKYIESSGQHDDKTSNDVRKLQRLMKVYRMWVINRWKSNKHLLEIHLSVNGVETNMDPTKPEDIARVEIEFMTWARDNI
jgi:hypothetical protein